MPDVPPILAPPTLPDQPATFRYLDPAAALAFRTPLQEHAPAADTKAAALLTAFGLMFALLARFGGALGRILSSPGGERWILLALLILFAGLALGAIVQAFRTLSPRFPPGPESLAFFGDIARLERDDYVARVAALTHEHALEHMLRYNHTLATICVDKFRHLRRGLSLFRWAFFAWAVLLVLLNFQVVF